MYGETILVCCDRRFFHIIYTIIGKQHFQGSFPYLLIPFIFQIVELSFLVFESDNGQTSFVLFSLAYLSYPRIGRLTVLKKSMCFGWHPYHAPIHLKTN